MQEHEVIQNWNISWYNKPLTKQYNMKHSIFMLIASLFLGLTISSCRQGIRQDTSQLDSVKIVSINGTVSEILVGLGLEDQIIGVDVASTYPESLQSKPKVGHSRQLSAEGILSLGPDMIFGTELDVKPELAEQLKTTGVSLHLFKREYSPEGTRNLIRSIADTLGLQAKGDSLITQLNQDLALVDSMDFKDPKPRVLFIYARGAGTMMVGGTGTEVDKMIALAGGVNAITGFEDYKPLTSEAVVAANPDVILLFDSGLSSLGGVNGIMQVQGIAETPAGKNRRFVEMDGQYLSGFSPRLGKAIQELASKIHQ